MAGSDEFFDKNNLAFLHQDTTATGKVSRFSKLVDRDSVEVEQPARKEEPVREARGDGEERAAEGEIVEEEQAAADPADMLERQHEQVREMFATLESGDIAIAPDLLNALGLHLALEEAIVYPMLLDSELDETVRESIVEHKGSKVLIRDLVDAPVADDAWWAAMRVLRRQVEEHMEREEDVVLPVLRELEDEPRIALMQEMEAFTIETLDIGADAPLESALSNVDARPVEH